MDAIFPGTFNFGKVKWSAKFDYEFVENYKILQNAFDKNGVKRHVEVSKDNLFHDHYLLFVRNNYLMCRICF